MLELGLWTAAVTLSYVAEIRLSVTTVMSQLNFPSLRVHDEANAQRDDTMDDIRMRHCWQCGSVPAYERCWEEYWVHAPDWRPGTSALGGYFVCVGGIPGVWCNVLCLWTCTARRLGCLFGWFDPDSARRLRVQRWPLGGVPGCSPCTWSGTVDGIGATPRPSAVNPNRKRPTGDPLPGPLQKKKTPALPANSTY